MMMIMLIKLLLLEEKSINRKWIKTIHYGMQKNKKKLYYRIAQTSYFTVNNRIFINQK